MKPDDQALPLTRRQLDIWLAQQSGRSGTEWQLGLFTRIEGTVERDALEWAIRRALQGAEPVRAAFFEADGQVFQRAIDYSDVELAFYDVSCSRLPVQEAYQLASSIQRTPMPFTGPLCKFALFRTRPDEFYWFACCRHIIIDGLSIALVGRRISAICSAIVSGVPIPPAFFGLSQDFVDFKLEYEASNDYLEDMSAHHILRVFGVAVVMTTALRGWRSFDLRPPLLIHVSKGGPVFASTTSDHRKLHRRREARACPVANATSRYITASHIRGSRNRPNPAARARVTELRQESHQELCRNTRPTLSGSARVWIDWFDSRLRASGWRRAGRPISKPFWGGESDGTR
jgi:hypothetical protein